MKNHEINKGLYIHIPFCERKCPYCDFYSIVDTDKIQDYVNSIIRNIKHISNDKNNIDTIYFGGGTPSLLTSEQIYIILSSVNVISNAEISMECNPNSVDLKYLSEIKQAGINRISFGVQSLNDNELKLLGRLHDSKTAVSAILNAEKAGFDNISADLMLAVSSQNMNSLTENIEKLSSLPLKHISAYMLKIEPDTPYFNNTNIIENIPNEDDTADMYLYTIEKLAAYGFKQYEISNFAKQGFECRHNLKYWKCEEYYGIGSSAHSYINGIRYACKSSVDEFITSDLQNYEVTDENAGGFDEFLMLNLRLTKSGYDTSTYSTLQSKILKQAEIFIKHGLLVDRAGKLTLTSKGCLVSNEIIFQLINCL